MLGAKLTRHPFLSKPASEFIELVAVNAGG